MLRYAVVSDGKPADYVCLDGAYLLGTDDVPLRAEIAFEDGTITCKKQAAGPAGLALLWPVDQVGKILLETIRVPERDEPYVLQVELARGRLMRLMHKLEDWGMFEMLSHADLAERFERARDLLIKALKGDPLSVAAEAGERALTEAIQASEEIARVHAKAFFERRCQTGPNRQVLGCSVGLDPPTPEHGKLLTDAFDFVTVPISWREIEPNEQSFNWKPLDTWVEWLAKSGIPIRGSALLSLSESSVPDWLYMWEHDFDTLRDLAFEHIRRVINRYGQYIQTWDVVSGIHTTNCFNFNFEQLMELTRMAMAITKQVAPRGVAVIDLLAPWGEYYARNQRTIPPVLYAEMVVQSGLDFEAFGLQFRFDRLADGHNVRDFFQISSILDLYGKLGKPLHVTAFQVPSATVKGGAHGHWREPWSRESQAAWVERFLEIALSKPFVEKVIWHGLVDGTTDGDNDCGVVGSDLAPKPAYERFVETKAVLNQHGRSRGG